MQLTVFNHFCHVAAKLFACDATVIEDKSSSNSNTSSSSNTSSGGVSVCGSGSGSPSGDQITQRVHSLMQYLNHTLDDTDITKNDSACAALLGMQRLIVSHEHDDASTSRKLLLTIDQRAIDAFATTSSFKIKLLCTKMSILCALYLHNYFNHNEVEGQKAITEMRVQLLSHLSGLFSQLSKTVDVKNAVSEEFERRDVSTSIWLRLNHQTHTEDGLQTLADMAHLQSTLESLFHPSLVDHAFDVRNSHGAIVSLQVKRLFGHQAPITVLAITDTHLYSGSSDKTIIEWDLTTHTQLNCLEGHDGTLRALVVSPDSDMLYSACEAGVIASWDLCVMSQTASVQQCHDFPITALALSAGRLFSADDKGTLKAWDACMIGTPDHDELEWPSKQAHTHTITALAATATNLYSAGIYVKVWDSQTLTMILKVKMHSGLTTAMCLRGDRIYSGSRAIKVWDVYTLERTSAPSLKKHSHPVTAIAVSHDGKRLYSAAHVIKEWDLTSAEEAINVLREHNSNVTCLAVSPNMLYSGSLDCNEIFYRAIEDTSSVGVDCVRISQHSDSIL